MTSSTSVRVSTRSLAEPDFATATAATHADIPCGYEAWGQSTHGTFCEVLRIRNTNTHKLFALKRLSAKWEDDSTAMALFQNEIEVLNTVKSRHIAKLIDSDLNAGRPYTVLEWIDGPSLEQKLNQSGYLPIGVAVWIARQCAQALDELARSGFSHGDIKPSNIMISGQNAVKLIDLSFARSLNNMRETPHVTDGLMTGTADYLAPEALSRANHNFITRDIYSLGVLLFKMLAGKLPFAGETVADILRHQRATKPPMLRRWRPMVPRELAELVNRLLAKQPIRRPQSYPVLVRELVEMELATLSDRLPSC